MKAEEIYLRGFFAINFFFIINLINATGYDWSLHRPAQMVELMGWIYLLPHPGTEICIIAAALLFGAAPLFWGQSRKVRILAFLASLIFYGRYNNYDHIDHNYYFIIHPLFFAVLPATLTGQQARISSFFCLFSVFLPFGFAGVNKTISSIADIIQGQHNLYLDPYSFFHHVAKEAPLVEETQRAILWALDHPVSIHFLFLAGIVLQALSPFAVTFSFRVRQVTLLLFALFQLTTSFFMNIFFEQATLMMIFAAGLYPHSAPHLKDHPVWQRLSRASKRSGRPIFSKLMTGLRFTGFRRRAKLLG